ncbi:SDA1-domain-containing protein [Paraphysoderma sedebokerense]|nr:SDA1-domain-containing protein [Paraphysoderma sedebokerense]
MGKSKRHRAALLPTNLPQLQNLIKRDPTSYKEEFSQQLRHFESSLSIFNLNPTSESKEFGELITFISHVVTCFPSQCSSFPSQIMDLISKHHQILHPNLRRTIVQSLILMRNKDFIQNTTLLPLFFLLFKCHDKSLRELLYTHIVTDIKNSNAKHKNNKLNKTLQNFMYTVLTPPPGYEYISKPNYSNTNTNAISTGGSAEQGWSAIAARKSLEVCIELYKKNVWNDAKTVNVIAEACFSPLSKIMVTAIHFFLGNDVAEDDESDNDDAPDISRLKHQHLVGRKTKSKARQMEKAKAAARRKENKKSKAETFNFFAIHLLNDPQTFAEKLFSRLKSSTEPFEVRLKLMNLISRLVGLHKLMIFPFYTFLQRYLQPHQRDVTLVLVYLAQASHDLVPPEHISPVVRCIADNFVNESSSAEVMAAGLNSIREISSRCPLAMEADLLQDLTQYKTSKAKPVMMGARSLISLFRDLNPELLKKKDRGKVAAMGMKDFKPLQYGEVRASDRIDGIELLEEEMAKEGITADAGDDNDEDWEGFEVASDSGSESGWIDVPDNSPAIDIDMGTDSENEGENAEDSDDEIQQHESQDGGSDGEKISEDEMIDFDEFEEIEGQNESENEEKEIQNATIDSTSSVDLNDANLPLEARKILTPADFAKIAALRTQQETENLVNPKKRKQPSSSTTKESTGEFLNESDILPSSKKPKSDYETRMASILAGREGREKYGSRKGKKHEKGDGTKTNYGLSNKEKKKTKNYLMVVHGRGVRSKKGRSLTQRQKVLREHIKRQKMGK